ncbi:MAG TPA: LysM peptidoglycan-binding domain-containing protein, partial [Treponemataceae bacterium]|nr:LysM peptidoglycan-binding domain-containing protein [Treponemataceae bacterium]
LDDIDALMTDMDDDSPDETADESIDDIDALMTDMDDDSPDEPEISENELDDFVIDDLPDFDTNDDLDIDSPALASSDEEVEEGLDFENTPDFEENTEDSIEESLQPAFIAADPNPSQLYDESLSDDVEEVERKERRKLRLPIIICVICALLCIAAVILIFILAPIPAKTVETTTENIVKTQPPIEIEQVFEEELEEPTKEAENIIKIVEEDTVPEPVAPVTQQKTQDVEYNLKWGDTLWDLSNTYYRTPWLYHIIAEHNNIEDPDWIIAGSDINIPAR